MQQQQEVAVSDAVARRTKTSEKFQESVLKAFYAVRKLLDDQDMPVSQVEDRQVQIEESHTLLKSVCDQNFKVGSDHIGYLMDSSDRCFNLIGVAGDQLVHFSSALATFKCRLDTGLAKVQEVCSGANQALLMQVSEYVSKSLICAQRSSPSSLE